VSFPQSFSLIFFAFSISISRNDEKVKLIYLNLGKIEKEISKFPSFVGRFDDELMSRFSSTSALSARSSQQKAWKLFEFVLIEKANQLSGCD
jgi:hypothetical protein